jgi:hypothetical protein
VTKRLVCRGEELEYLGYWITHHGIQPVSKKVEAISNLTPPKKRQQLRRIVVLVNYHGDMWLRHSHILAPLTALTSAAFDNMKCIMARETILA